MGFLRVVWYRGGRRSGVDGSGGVINDFLSRDRTTAPWYRWIPGPGLLAWGPGARSWRAQGIALSRGRLVRLAPQESRDIQQILFGPAGGQTVLGIEPAEASLGRLGRRRRITGSRRGRRMTSGGR